MKRRGFIIRLLGAIGLIAMPQIASAESNKNKPIIMFHGGCGGCTQQIVQHEGVYFCAKNCCYFDADWSLPDMNNRPKTEAEIIKERIKKEMDKS